MFAMQSALRHNMHTDISLYNLTVSNYLYAFFRQHRLVPQARLHGIIYVDDSSFLGQEKVLGTIIIKLEAFALALQAEYPFLKLQIRTSLGLGDAYLSTMHACLQKRDCRYVVFLEDDRIFDPEKISHSQGDLVELFDEHPFINYVRFKHKENHPAGLGWDGPCTVEDTSMKVPLRRTGAFANNPHMLRPGQVLKFLNITYSPVHARHNWGVECYDDARRPGLYSFCHAATFDCLETTHASAVPCIIDRASASNCGSTWQRPDFHQINASTCLNSDQAAPNWDACGLFLYGDNSLAYSTVHLEGQIFNATQYWESHTAVQK